MNIYALLVAFASSDIVRVEMGYIFYAALYYVVVVYPIVWFRHRRKRARAAAAIALAHVPS